MADTRERGSRTRPPPHGPATTAPATPRAPLPRPRRPQLPAAAPTCSPPSARSGGTHATATLPNQDKAPRPKEPLDAGGEKATAAEESALACVFCMKHPVSASLIEESIRIGYNDIGDFYWAHGHLDKALRSYLSLNDYCTTSKHIIGMSMHVILVSIELGQFDSVIPYVSKAEQAVDPFDTITTSKLQVAVGLAYMRIENYKLAANKFLEIAPELGSNYSEVIAPQDVAVYGVLCALASFDRSDMKSKIIDNLNFDNFLEEVPEARELVNDFYSCHYGSCIKLLEKLQPDLLLDIHLYEQLERLYKQIRNNVLKDMKRVNAARKMTSARLAYLDLAELHDDAPVPENVVYAAHLAGQPKLAITGLLAYLAGRFSDVLEMLSTADVSEIDISQSEFEFYHEAYASVLESKLRMIKILENKLEKNCDDGFIMTYLKKDRRELEEMCSNGVALVNEKVLPAAPTKDAVIFCHNLVAVSFY